VGSGGERKPKRGTRFNDRSQQYSYKAAHPRLTHACDLGQALGLGIRAPGAGNRAELRTTREQLLFQRFCGFSGGQFRASGQHRAAGRTDFLRTQITALPAAPPDVRCDCQSRQFGFEHPRGPMTAQRGELRFSALYSRFPPMAICRQCRSLGYRLATRG
jgi:hypothetical protein